MKSTCWTWDQTAVKYLGVWLKRGNGLWNSVLLRKTFITISSYFSCCQCQITTKFTNVTAISSVLTCCQNPRTNAKRQIQMSKDKSKCQNHQKDKLSKLPPAGVVLSNCRTGWPQQTKGVDWRRNIIVIALLLLLFYCYCLLLFYCYCSIILLFYCYFFIV